MTSTYQLLDCGGFRKLEQVGHYKIIRPSPQAVWSPRNLNAWKNPDAEFERFSGGSGEWTTMSPDFKQGCQVEMEGLTIKLQPTDFGHIGVFPEQQKHWQMLGELIRARKPHGDGFKVLNLFAYTGIATLACAQAGAEVVHLDASKTSVNWARENANIANLAAAPIRWIVDDASKFTKREVTRGSKYHGVILDPPSYGRGQKSEVWKIEDDLTPLMRFIKNILAEDFCFVLLTSHSAGYTPTALRNILTEILPEDGHYQFHEMLTEAASGVSLPSGNACLFTRRQP